MIVQFANKVLDCKEMRLATGQVREGDLVSYCGETCYVESIARQVPMLENLSKLFTQFLLVASDGRKIPVRGKTQWEVYRVKKNPAR